MPSTEFLQEWAWLIAVGLSFGFVGLLMGIRQLQARQARNRAAGPEEDAPGETHTNFLRARRNFLILVVIFVTFLIVLEVWNLHFYLERQSPVR